MWKQKNPEVVEQQKILKKRLEEYNKLSNDDVHNLILDHENFSLLDAHDWLKEMEEENIFPFSQAPLTVVIKTNYSIHPSNIQSTVQKAIIPHLFDLNRSFRRVTLIAFIYLATGLTFFLAPYLLNFFNEVEALKEIFIIMSWIFIWNGLDKFIFERHDLRFQIARLKRIYFAIYVTYNRSY